MAEQKEQSPIYLIDGSSYLYRAFFSTPREFTSSKGVPTRAVYVITNMLLKILREKSPRYIAVTWDAKGPTFRHELYKAYKANRPPMPEDLSVQVPYVRRLVDALGLPQLEVEGVEADDIIATLARNFGEKLGRKVIIVSGDKDLLQLVSENVVLWDPMKDETVDLKTFREKYGLDPAQFNDVLSLSGDSADNIPGVPGVGPKTALKLVSQYKSVENLLKELDGFRKSKLKERLKEAADELALWKRLTSLDSNVAVKLDPEYYRRREMNETELLELFRELDFESLIPMVSSEKVLSYDSYRIIQNEQTLKNWLDENKGKDEVVIDTETTSQRPMEARLVGISLCFTPPEAAYLPVGHQTGQAQLDLEVVRKHLLPLLKDKKLGKIGQNIKYDLIILRRHGLPMENIAGDTMIASYLLDPTRRRHNLDEIARDSLGHKMISYKEVTRELGRGQDFSHVPVEKAMEYSCEDVHVTSVVKDKFHGELKEKGLWTLYSEVEIPLVPVLADMEMTGILVDKQGLRDLRKEFAQRLAELEKEIFDLAGHEFNIKSTKQLAQVLFQEQNLPQLKKTKKKTGYSTDVEVLKSLAKIHPLPEKLLEFRNLSKLKSTYVDGLEKEINPETGRI
ncbi:MAG: DNA polymerase I, partial [Thermodesulfatator sp.]